MAIGLAGLTDPIFLTRREFFNLWFFLPFFQCNERECRCLLSFYDVLNIISSHRLFRFLIIVIGNFEFLNLCEDIIYLNNSDVWFSLYQSNSPSYFICYNTMLEIDEDSVRLFM